MSVQATQPLLRGNGAQVNRAPLILSRIRTDIAITEFEAAVRNMLLDLENSYWDLQFNYRFLETSKIGRDSAGDLAAGIRVDQRRQGHVAGRSAVARAVLLLPFADRDGLAGSVCGGEPPAVVDGDCADRWRIAPPDRPPTLARIEYEWQAAHAESLVRSAELRRQRWQVKQRETELIVARNQLLPQLDLVGRYSWLGMGDDLITANRRGLDFPDEGSTAWDELTDGNFQEFSFGLQFTPPRIGARKEMAGCPQRRTGLGAREGTARRHGTQRVPPAHHRHPEPGLQLPGGPNAFQSVGGHGAGSRIAAWRSSKAARESRTRAGRRWICC